MTVESGNFGPKGRMKFDEFWVLLLKIPTRLDYQGSTARKILFLNLNIPLNLPKNPQIWKLDKRYAHVCFFFAHIKVCKASVCS